MSIPDFAVQGLSLAITVGTLWVRRVPKPDRNR